MIYAFRCLSCGRKRDSLVRTPFPCECGSLYKRDYRSTQFRAQTAFQPHFNNAVGSYVRTEFDMKEQLRRASSRQSERTGIFHDYQYIDPSELRRDHEPRTDTEAIESQARAWYGGSSPAPPPVTPAKSQVGRAQFGEVL